MDWGVYNLKVVVTGNNIRAERKGFDAFEIDIVHLFAKDFDEVFVAFEFNVLYALNAVDIFDCVGVVWSGHLGTIVPICLVAVVFFWVVRCSDDYTALAAEFANCERHFGSWTRTFEEVNLDSVSRENVCADFSKQAAVVAHVVTDNNLDFREVLESIFQVVGEALSGSANGVDVHAVRANAHNATQTAGSEFEVFVETFNKVGFVFVFKHGLNSCLSFGIVAIAKPHFCFLSYLL